MPPERSGCIGRRDGWRLSVCSLELLSCLALLSGPSACRHAGPFPSGPYSHALGANPSCLNLAQGDVDEAIRLMYESKRSIYDEAEATQKSYDPMSMIYEIAKVQVDARHA